MNHTEACGGAGACLLAAACLLWLVVSGPAWAQPPPSPWRLKRSIVADVEPWTHWNWAAFDQDKLVSLKGYQYVLYWSADRTLVLVRRKLADHTVQTLRLEKLRLSSNDGHRNTVLGVSRADGRLHLSWDHHGDELRYTRSRSGFLTAPPARMRPEDIEPPQRMLAKHSQRGVTYPRFFADGKGTLMFLYRVGGSGSGDSYLHRYDAATGRWARVGRLVRRRGRYPPWKDSPSRNAYFHDLLFDPRGRLHATWVFRETSATWASNHDLHYAYSDDGGVTWRNNAGRAAADLSRGDPIELGDPGLVVREVPVFSWIMNQGSMALDSRGRPHVVTFKSPRPHRPEPLGHSPPGEIRRQQRFVHYWRDADGAWHGGEPIDPGGAVPRRGDLVVGPGDDLYFHFPTPKGFRCLHARGRETWRTWSSCPLTGPEFTANDASKHDRALWRKQGILSFTAWGVEGSRKRFAILDFELPRRAPQRPADPPGGGNTP